MKAPTTKQKRWRLGQILATSLTFVLAASLSAVEPAVGQEQSPINILPQNLTVVDGLPPLSVHYSTTAKLNVVNTGSPDEYATIKANVAAGAGRLRVEGIEYKLLQFHSHLPSEHQIDSEVFPKEFHLVHQAPSGALLVVGILVKEGRRHAELDKIFSRLPQKPNDTLSVPRFDLRKLLPASRESYRYRGSLTTPPFTEGVKWIVLAEPIEMSHTQIEAFHKLFHEGNTRHPQPLNGRKICTDLECSE